MRTPPSAPWIVRLSVSVFRSKVRAASEIQRYGLRSMLTQAIKADDYRGKYVRFSGDVKVEHVEPQAGLMVAIFFPPPRKLSERWRQGRPEKSMQEKWGQGTHDWMRYETTIFVPENAQYIHFGVIMYGTGQIWLANARLEVIEQDGMLSA